ncbi:MAG: hypothetical protein AMXMBFR84_43760 [Candidatus Hydrogenedentota bacterium]
MVDFGRLAGSRSKEPVSGCCKARTLVVPKRIGRRSVLMCQYKFGRGYGFSNQTVGVVRPAKPGYGLGGSDVERLLVICIR